MLTAVSPCNHAKDTWMGSYAFLATSRNSKRVKSSLTPVNLTTAALMLLTMITGKNTTLILRKCSLEMMRNLLPRDPKSG